MTAIKELNDWIDEELQKNHYPKHNYREWDLFFKVKEKLIKLAKKDLEAFNKSLDSRANLLFDFKEDLEEVVK